MPKTLVAREVLKLFIELVESSSDHDVPVMDNLVFRGSLLRLLTGFSKVELTADTRNPFVELIFIIVSRLRVNTDEIAYWFATSDPNTAEPARFVLLDFLRDQYLSSDCSGGFARQALCYIVALGEASEELYDWLAQSSEFPVLITCSLAAMYSQLSRAEIFDEIDEEFPGGLSNDWKAGSDSENAESSSLAAFKEYLVFFQDLLQYSKGVLRSDLLHGFQTFFLEPVLGPSFHDSSGSDISSSVSAVTYLELLLNVLDDEDLLHISLTFLLRFLPAKAQKLLATNSSSIATATLRLVIVLFRKCCSYSAPAFLSESNLKESESKSIQMHAREMDLLSELSSTAESTGFSKCYSAYLADALVYLESHGCSHGLVHLLDTVSLADAVDDDDILRIPIDNGKPTNMMFYTLRSEEPFARTLYDMFGSFFCNSVHVNLLLTRFVTELACCSRVDLEGWLLYADINTEVGDVPSPRSIRPERNALPTPPFLAILKILSGQVRQYKTEVEDLQEHLAIRREALDFMEELGDALQPSPAMQTFRPNRAGSIQFTDNEDSRSNDVTLAESAPVSSLSLTPERSGANKIPSTPTRPPSSSANSPFVEHFSATKKRISSIRPISTSALDVSGTTFTSTTAEGSGMALDDIFAPVQSSTTEITQSPPTLSVSHLCNNIIIFEEFVKELRAVIQHRRAYYESLKF
ncbi:hypothetical protein SAICODRAFT_70820 [Saitoella complicata NRRL Y-17804]|nr:uncharacterized protein SAICODRAFT_70820 [Saitoella complicata NRRL Y-17804]ODQ53684.1 hypothetical protein SAICODRAFT_70820 [Saitoella complicata NRRL Y-17804]